MTTQKWRMVPVEPTPEMKREGWEAAVDCVVNNVDLSDIAYVYGTVLEAAPLPPKLSDERILEIYEEAKANWNAQADQCNQWSDLGVDEVVTLVARAIEREILGGGDE